MTNLVPTTRRTALAGVGLTLIGHQALGTTGETASTQYEAAPQAVTRTENDWLQDAADEINTNYNGDITVDTDFLNIVDQFDEEETGDGLMADVTTIEDTEYGYLTIFDFDDQEFELESELSRVALRDDFGTIEEVAGHEPIGMPVYLNETLIVPNLVDAEGDFGGITVEAELLGLDPLSLEEQWSEPLGEFDIEWNLDPWYTATDGDRGYLLNPEAVIGFDETGGDRWTEEFYEPQTQSLAVGGGRVFFSTENGVVSLDATDGEDAITSEGIGQPLNAPLTVHEHDGNQYIIAISSASEETYVLDATTLEIEHEVAVSHDADAMMAVSVDDTVYTFDGEHFVVAIDPATGDVTESDELTGVNGRLIGTENGLLRGHDEGVDVISYDTLDSIGSADLSEDIEAGNIPHLTPIEDGSIVAENVGTVYKIASDPEDLEGPTSNFDILTPEEDRVTCRVIEFEEDVEPGDGEIESYEWVVTNTDGDTIATGEGPEFSTVFHEADTFTVELTATDENGLSDTYSEDITIEENGEESDLEPIVGETPPKDLNGDGLYRDIDGDCHFDINDVQAFYENLHTDAVQDNAEAYNFSGMDDATATIFDVQALFKDLEAGVSQ